MRACLLGLRILAAALLFAAPAVASAGAPAGVAIRWSAPPGCPEEPALRAAVERLLARPLGRAGERLEVDGEVTRDPGATGRYRLRLAIALGAGPRKERRLDGETCAQITEAAAVVLALAIDAEPHPVSSRAGEPPSPSSVPSPSPPGAAPPPVPSSDAEPPPPLPAALPAFAGPAAPVRPAWDLAALGGVDLASLPGPAAGLGVGAAVDLGANRIELRAMAWLPRRATLVSPASAGGGVALYAAGLRYCRWLAARRLGLAPCAGLEAGALVASAFGVESPTSGVGRWLAPQIGLLGVVRPTPRVAVSLAADGLALVFRDRFVIDGAGDLYRPPPATFRAVLGVHLRFP